jgi:hypothetical protein
MRKSVWSTIAVAAAIAAVGGCVEVPVASAASKICPKFKGHEWHSAINSSSGNKYTSEAVGSVTCTQAATWIKKLSADKAGAPGSKLKNGPKGYHCFAAELDKHRYVEAGTCYTGTAAFPKNGFTWGV